MRNCDTTYDMGLYCISQSESTKCEATRILIQYAVLLVVL